jgi:hypothetical protein
VADDLTTTATVSTVPVGTVIASDLIGGVSYQRVKATLGADGTAVDPSAGAGAVGTGTQRMTLASDDPAVTALQLIDNASVAHDAAAVAGVSQIGLEARTTDGTAVTSGDAVRALADTLGKQVVLLGAVHDLQSRGTTNYTNNTAADVIAAAGAGVRIAVMSVLVTNAHATVSTKVEIRDGTTVKILGYATAVGGGFAINGGGVPLFISTANTAVTARAVTTGTDTDVTISGYRIAN